MTMQNKQELIKTVVAILQTTIQVDEQQPQKNIDSTPVTMLTIKECSQLINGLSEHTVRKLVAQNKIPYFRTGEGKRGKILISKAALLEFLPISQ